jgi:hypothetical protein
MMKVCEPFSDDYQLFAKPKFLAAEQRKIQMSSLQKIHFQRWFMQSVFNDLWRTSRLN